MQLLLLRMRCRQVELQHTAKGDQGSAHKPLSLLSAQCLKLDDGIADVHQGGCLFVSSMLLQDTNIPVGALPCQDSSHLGQHAL
jgi:hypothetical protein